jgi:hypothetical protein
MTTSLKFKRAVGGLSVADDLVDYFLGEPSVVGVGLSLEVGGWSHEIPELRGANPVVDRVRSECRGHVGLRHRVGVTANYAEAGLDLVYVEVGRFLTKVKVNGAYERLVNGEKIEIVRRIGMGRRYVGRFLRLFAVLAAVASIIALVLVLISG